MSDLKSSAYWVGHLFTILATVIGVYFAASSGFEVAKKIEVIQADRGTYFLSESLYQELNFNVKNLDQYIDRIETEKYVFKEHIAGINLNEFVLKSSMYSDSVFEIEPILLTEVSIYYFTVGNALKHYYDSQMQSPSTLMQVIKQQTKLLKEQKTLERLAAYNKALAKSIEDRGLDLSQPEF